jgi:hypothetical protein
MVSWFQQQLAPRSSLAPAAVGHLPGECAAQAADEAGPSREMRPAIPIGILETWLQPMVADGEVTFNVKE